MKKGITTNTLEIPEINGVATNLLPPSIISASERYNFIFLVEVAVSEVLLVGVVEVVAVAVELQ